MQSENIVQEIGMIESKPSPHDLVSPNTKLIQALDDKTNISQNVSSNNDQSILGKRLCTERGGISTPMDVSGDRSPFSDPQQNISASYGNSANISFEKDQAIGAHT